MNSELLRRSRIFGNPDRLSPQLSPDGTILAYIAPREGVLNIWIAPVDDLQAAVCITNDTSRGIRTFGWAYTGSDILFIQDVGGDENWHVYRVNVHAKERLDLTPHPNVSASIMAHHPSRPEEVVLAVNDRVPHLHDPVCVNLVTGASRRLVENPGFASILVDPTYRVRYGIRFGEDGGHTYFIPTPEKGQGSCPEGIEGWKALFDVPPEDTLTTRVLGFDGASDGIYLSDSRGRDRAALVRFDPNTKETQEIAEDPQCDLSHILKDPRSHRPLVAAFIHMKTRYQVLDTSIAEGFQALQEACGGPFKVLSMTLTMDKWVVAVTEDTGPARYCLWDARGNTLRTLFTQRDSLSGQALRPMEAMVISARDGLPLVSYLTLPPEGRSGGPLPMVLVVHGGPWSRDHWGFNPIHQHFADRGYAVLAVNFRGSTGFGKGFINAGDLEWGGKMQDDLEDAVAWCIKEGIADPERIAIMGGSYGGFATLVGLTRTPELFACGIDIVGPSNLLTFMETIPAYWRPMIAQLKKRVGDPDTPEGKDFLMSRSPLTHVGKVCRPLLIAQGANDPRIKQRESDQFVGAMEDNGIPVTYVVYPDEGHGFRRPENSLSFQALAEAFLHTYLGGRLEPIQGDLKGASFTVKAGAEGIPGLETHLARRE